MTDQTDRFVLASFALWAGDFENVRVLLRDPRRQSTTFARLEYLDNPDHILDIAAALRLRQLANKRGEFRKIAQSNDATRGVLSEQPFILATEHLRGAVWRTSAREFLFQAYLNDLGWEAELFERVTELAQAADDDASARIGVEPSTSARIDKRLGGGWVIEGNPFVQVEVTDLGLIEATALWTGTSPLQEFAPIRSSFEALLETLDSAVHSPT